MQTFTCLPSSHLLNLVRVLAVCKQRATTATSLAASAAIRLSPASPLASSAASSAAAEAAAPPKELAPVVLLLIRPERA
jgi:hypothetical protein